VFHAAKVAGALGPIKLAVDPSVSSRARLPARRTTVDPPDRQLTAGTPRRMTTGPISSPAVWGFLTVLAHDQLGLAGGYLILNAAGRPLEFHTTTPLKPNRAQQILFGPTLEPYLYGEQIGQTLVCKGSLLPAAVYTDHERVLAVRDFVAAPVALVLPSDNMLGAAEAAPRPSEWHIDPPRRPGGELAPFVVGNNRLAVPGGRDADRQAIAQHMEALAGFDLSEPFGRIREAIEEAHRVTRASSAA
jgi:hypothetical protein